MNAAKYRSQQDTWTQGESDFQQDPKHKAKDTHERLQNNNIYVL